MVPLTHARRALLLLLLLVAAARTSWAGYMITDLGALSTLPNRPSYAWDINDAGQVVGSAARDDGTLSLFVWDAEHGMQDLGIPGRGPFYINNAGQISGTADDVDIGGFLWNSPTDVRRLLSPNGAVAFAGGLNDLGVVAGDGYVPGNPWLHAFFWDVDGNPHLLAADPDQDSSVAAAVNNAGQIVGWTHPWGRSRAFVWDETNGMQDMGTLDDGESLARAINNAGVAVGYVQLDDLSNRAFIWDADNGMRPLEAPEGGPTIALDINDAGQVVGGWHLWDHGVVTNLQEEAASPAGWILSGAHAINNSGQIVGWGRNPDREDRGFLLTPVPEPATVALLLSGLLGLAAVARRHRRMR